MTQSEPAATHPRGCWQCRGGWLQGKLVVAVSEVIVLRHTLGLPDFYWLALSQAPPQHLQHFVIICASLSSSATLIAEKIIERVKRRRREIKEHKHECSCLPRCQRPLGPCRAWLPVVVASWKLRMKSIAPCLDPCRIVDAFPLVYNFFGIFQQSAE